MLTRKFTEEELNAAGSVPWTLPLGEVMGPGNGQYKVHCYSFLIHSF